MDIYSLSEDAEAGMELYDMEPMPTIQLSGVLTAIFFHNTALRGEIKAKNDEVRTHDLGINYSD